MKKKIWIYLILTITLLFAAVMINHNYQKKLMAEKNNKISESYTKHNGILVSYTDRINKKEEGLLEELNEKIAKSTNPLDIGTYKNALSYYYLTHDDYETHTRLALESIEHYEESPYGGPLILDTYTYMISNTMSRKNYGAALKYSYASFEKLDQMDYSFVSDHFEKDIEVSLNCNLINIFVNNNLSNKAEKYYNEILTLSEDDPSYVKNERLIVFAKLIYTDAIGDYDSALKYSYKYHDLAIQANSPSIEGLRVNIATAMLKNDIIDEALPHIIAAENYYKGTNNKSALGNVYRSYGEYYLKKKRYNDAYTSFITAYDYYKPNPKLITDQIGALEKILTSNIEGNLNKNIDIYLKEYISLSDPSLTAEGPANLFNTMDEINSKSYESKLILQQKDAEALNDASKIRNKLIFYLLTIVVLFVILTFILFNEIRTRKQYELILQETVNTDYLTKCYSRNYGINLLNNLIKSATSFSIAILDIDDFKHINDTYGHLVGDEALKLLGEFLRDKLSGVGISVRYGGEEFIVIFENMDIKEASLILENLREEFSKLTFGDNLSCTLSIGAKSWDGEILSKLLNETDMLLYEAKNSGKNKVFIKE